MKKPCKKCPYKVGTDNETFEGLGTELYMYDGDFVHDCHIKTNFYKIDGDNMECVGSKLFGENLLGAKHLSIKDINQFT